MAEEPADSTVLVAADLRELRERYVRQLSDAYDVAGVATPDGVRDALSGQVAVLVLDADLPATPVAEFVADVGADADCDVVVMAPDGGGADRPADASLSKPVSAAELRETVDCLVARRAYEDAVGALHAACEQRRERLAAGGDGADAEATVDRLLARADDAAADLDAADFRAVFRRLD
ncbi:DNA-binding transcriptional response regulator [Halobacterium litoreum]|uniref:Response regulatory domain-containing protein n=1 Tax=Halobacterium litoreum TaxID=2039234 RepID=A0ABD5NIL4_9EURY|nr:hypothetical protein [Halobacterium litoreum]UHH12230.1 hypothetical protein LT972_08680 [Halobacterium litoreum]